MTLLFGSLSFATDDRARVVLDAPTSLAGIPEVLAYEAHHDGPAILGHASPAKNAPVGFQTSFYRFQFGSVVFKGRLFDADSDHHSQDSDLRGLEFLVNRLRAGDVRVLDELPGGFSLAFWDRVERRLLLVRDHHGPAELFYCRQGDEIRFSSSLPFLLSQQQDTLAPDRLTTAFLLTGLSDRNGSRTFFESVRQVPPGHLLSVTSQDSRLHRYWSPWKTKSTRFSGDKDTVAAFREVFNGAVARAIDAAERPAVMLSGGLDSGAVALTASSLLTPKRKELLAYTAVPEFDATAFLPTLRRGDESQSAAAIAGRASNMVHRCIATGPVTPLSGARELLGILGHPAFGAVNGDWLLCLLRKAQADGADVLLTGQCGNATVSWTGSRVRLVRQFLSRGKLGKVKAEWRGFQSERNASALRTLRSVILAPLVPWQLAHRLFAMRDASEWLIDRSAIRVDVARQLDLFDRTRDALMLAKNVHHVHHRDAILQTGVYSPNAFNARVASAFGLRLEDPTSDRRVIEFCYGLSDDAYISQGRNRMLIRQAMAGELPEEVLWAKKTGVQSADVVLRVRESRKEIEEALVAAENSERVQSFLDVSRMRDVFEAALARQGYEVRARTASVLLRGLMTAEFLRRFQ